MKFWTIAGLLTLFGLLFFAGSFYSAERTVTVLSGYLKEFVVPPVEYDGRAYAIQRGRVVQPISPFVEAKVLRVAHASLMARADPMYAFPEMNLEAFAQSIRALSHSRTRVMESLEVDSSNELYDVLYPLSYLTNISELERLRRELARSPSDTTVRSYYEQLDDTIGTYTEHIDEKLKALTVVDRSLPADKKIRFQAGYANAAYIKDVLRTYRKYADEHRHALDGLRSCFAGDHKRCSAVEYPAQRVAGASGDTGTGNIPEKISRRLAVVEAFRRAPYAGHIYEPAVAVLNQSQCYLPFTPAYYLLWWEHRENEPSIFNPELLNELQLYDFQEGFQSNWMYAKKFIARGGPRYIYQPIASHYICPDLATDQSTLSGMTYAYEHPLPDFASATTAPYAGSLGVIKEAWDRIQTDTLLRETHVDWYADAVRSLLAEHDQNELKELIGSEAIYELEELYATVRLGTSEYPEMIMSLVSDNGAVPAYTYHGTFTSPGELFYVRSGIKLLLGGFNPSIAPQDVRFTEISAGALPSHVVQYSDIENDYTTEALVDMLQQSAQFEIEMGREAGNVYMTTSKNTD